MARYNRRVSRPSSPRPSSRPGALIPIPPDSQRTPTWQRTPPSRPRLPQPEDDDDEPTDPRHEPPKLRRAGPLAGYAGNLFHVEHCRH